ncbi:hypothetical protein D3C81_941190 [compost metagenome]
MARAPVLPLLPGSSFRLRGDDKQEFPTPHQNRRSTGQPRILFRTTSSAHIRILIRLRSDADSIGPFGSACWGHGLRRIRIDIGHARTGHGLRTLPHLPGQRCRHPQQSGALRVPAGGGAHLRAATGAGRVVGRHHRHTLAVDAVDVGAGQPRHAAVWIRAAGARGAAVVRGTHQLQLHRLPDGARAARRSCAAVCSGLRPVRYLRAAVHLWSVCAGALQR